MVKSKVPSWMKNVGKINRIGDPSHQLLGHGLLTLEALMPFYDLTICKDLKLWRFTKLSSTG